MDPDRLEERLFAMIDRGLEEEFLEYRISPQVEKKMLLHQLLHLRTLLCASKRERVLIDASDTGTGKTYTAAAFASELHLQPFVVCPKTVVSVWERVLRIFDLEAPMVVNYESLRSGGNHRWLKKVDGEYRWQLPRDHLLIFDEAHRARNPKSLNGQMVIAAKKSNCRMLLLSATLADRLDTMKLFVYLLGFSKTIAGARTWIKGVARRGSIHQELFPHRGSQMLISDLGDRMPANTVSTDCFVVDRAKQYDGLLKKIATLDPRRRLPEITRIRIELERLKLPVILDLAREGLDSGLSVAIFVNFTENLVALGQALNSRCLIDGRQERGTRDRRIADFQANRSRVIICNLKAGSEGMSLHDLDGRHPRMTLISPSYSSLNLVQCLGRAYRAGAKSPVWQRLILLAGTAEEHLAKRIADRLRFTEKITDRDLIPIGL